LEKLTVKTNFAPSGEFVLKQLGINPHNLRADFSNRWQRLQYRAVVQWLTLYKPKLDATNLEKVRGYLEAFHHLCAVEDWERASQVITIRLDTPTNEELHEQLNTWGYYRELLKLYRRILGKVNPSWDAIFFMVWAMFTMFWEIMPKQLNIIGKV
jgi:hypothetical protein